MCSDPIFSTEIYWPCFKFGFHYPEAFLNLPSALHDVDDLFGFILQISAYTVETVKRSIFKNGLLIQGTDDLFRHLTVICNVHRSYVFSNIVLTFAQYLCRIFFNHLRRSCYALLPNLFLVIFILGAEGDNKFLLYAVLIESPLFPEDVIAMNFLVYLTHIKFFIVSPKMETGWRNGPFLKKSFECFE